MFGPESNPQSGKAAIYWGLLRRLDSETNLLDRKLSSPRLTHQQVRVAKSSFH